MIATLVFAAAILPIGDVNPGTCLERASLSDIQPQGSGRTFSARHTIFVDGFALSKWYVHETDGGEIVWRRRGKLWCAVPVREGYLDQPALERLGVPRAAARTLRIERAAYIEAIGTIRRREPSAENEKKAPG